MQNNEMDLGMINNDLKNISKMFLELRKQSWKKLENQTGNNDSGNNDSLQEDFKRELNIFLDRFLPEKLKTEKDFLLAKFIMFFGFSNLENKQYKSIQDQVSQRVEELPILSLVDQLIAVFRKHLFDFFISYGQNYQKNEEVFFIDKTKNDIANLIIDTEMRRTLVDYHDRPSLVNSSTDFRIILKELDDKFEVILKKVKKQ